MCIVSYLYACVRVVGLLLLVARGHLLQYNCSTVLYSVVSPASSVQLAFICRDEATSLAISDLILVHQIEVWLPAARFYCQYCQLCGSAECLAFLCIFRDTSSYSISRAGNSRFNMCTCGTALVLLRMQGSASKWKVASCCFLVLLLFLYVKLWALLYSSVVNRVCCNGHWFMNSMIATNYKGCWYLLVHYGCCWSIKEPNSPAGMPFKMQSP